MKNLSKFALISLLVLNSAFFVFNAMMVISVKSEKVALLKESEEMTNRGIFIQDPINPLDDEFMGKISSYQGLRGKLLIPDAGGETTKAGYHDALDIPCPDFTPVHAIKDGVITECWPSYYNGGAKYYGHPTFGGYIEIEHPDGTKSIYAHLSMTEVKEGDIVSQGDIIGRSGGVVGRRGSGKSTGPHLHFAIKFNMNSFYCKAS